MRTRPFMLLFWCLVTTHAVWAQLTVQGQVVDAETQEPIEGVSVFLNNTSYHAVTDSIGAFTIIGMQGAHQLIAYKDDYKRSITSINRSTKARVELKRPFKPEQTKESQDAPNPYTALQLEEFLNTFKLDFLGRSRNAENCEILNPEVLTFNLAGGNTLRVTASVPIVIRNNRLGYDLTYHLKSYVRNLRTTSYVGHVFYQNTPGLELKPKHFQAREKAYNGSTAHFLRSVLAGKHNREGYKLQTATDVGGNWIYKEVPISNLAVYNNEGVYLFGAGKFRIIYLPERREYNYVRWLKANGIKEFGRGQYTDMEFAAQKVKILPSGTIDPPLGLVFRGYMGWEQMADALPMNYNPQ
ncbi:MAG: carboxypeptidase-like regulatory domain-containing protein [Cytophagales bacterium]|nr:carboxypeptidase-like regulatory domain-containing protein [Cytophagales bacterium]